MSHFHFVKLAVSNTLRVFVFLAMAHPAMAAAANVAQAVGEPNKASPATTSPISPDNIEAPVGFGFG